jgi:hypothetical protein
MPGHIGGLHSPLDPGQPPSAVCCLTCRGRVGPGYARCFRCDQHLAVAGPALLADAVVPVSYAIKGSAFTDCLWRYKSAAPAGARTGLLGLLLAFLHEHGPCVSRAAGMPRPSRLAVVPSGYGRPDPHPLLAMLGPHVRTPVAEVRLVPGRQSRDLDTGRFAVANAAGQHVLVIDDTWVSGASAQSVATAFKAAGAARVAVVVLGRFVNGADPATAAFTALAGRQAYDPARCAVHW